MTDARYRLSVVSRVIAAFGGGYALTSLLVIAGTILFSQMGVGGPEAALATSLVSFPVYAAVILAVFQARSTFRAWIGLVIAALPPALICALVQMGGAG